MRLWRRLISSIFQGHSPCPECHVRLQLTGAPPGNCLEGLIKQIAGDRRLAPIHWLEEQICDTLYCAELRKGAWALDIGLWGPALFRKEASRILAGVRPEFGRFVREGEGGFGD